MPTSPGKKTETQREGEKWGQEQLHPGNGGGHRDPRGGGGALRPGVFFCSSFFRVSTLALRGRARAVVVGSCCQHHEEPITPTLPAAGPVRARPAPATASSSRAPPPQPPHPTPVRGAVQRAAPSLRLETHSQAARERSATPPPPREAPFLSPRTGDAGCCPHCRPARRECGLAVHVRGRLDEQKRFIWMAPSHVHFPMYRRGFSLVSCLAQGSEDRFLCFLLDALEFRRFHFGLWSIMNSLLGLE